MVLRLLRLPCRTGLAWLIFILLTPSTHAHPPAPATYFIPNPGFTQHLDPAVRYVSLGGPYTYHLTESGFWLTLAEPPLTLRWDFLAANPRPQLQPHQPSPTRLTAYRGRTQHSTPTWHAIRYQHLYPGLALQIDSAGPQFLPQPGFNPAQISPPRLRLSGADLVGVIDSVLQLQHQGQKFTLPLSASPVAWQVEGQYGGESVVYRVGGGVASVDPPSPPTPLPAGEGSQSSLSRWERVRVRENHPPFAVPHYATYFGGSLWDEPAAIALGPGGDVFVAGHTLSLDFPLGSAWIGPQKEPQHNIEAFAIRFSAETGQPVYIALFIGDIEEFGTALAVDDEGNAYLTGHTDSSDFPTTPKVWASEPLGGYDAFVLKLGPAGELLYSTLLGGSDTDTSLALSLDSAGQVTVAGGTWSTDFPTTKAAPSETHFGQRDIFVTQLSADATQVRFSTLLGGASQEQAQALSQPVSDTVYLAGWTRSAEFPLGEVDLVSLGGFDAFVLGLDLKTGQLTHRARWGGSAEDRAFAVDITPAGMLLLGGLTTSADFPLSAGSYHGGLCDFSPCPDGFLLTYPLAGDGPGYGTFLGGSAADAVRALAWQSDTGRIYLTGETTSLDVPTTAGAWFPNPLGEQDGVVWGVDLASQTLGYASYVGGSAFDASIALAVDSAGLLHLTGKTLSSDLPLSPNAFTTAPQGDYDGFLLSFDPTLAPPSPPQNVYLPLVWRN